VLVVLLVEVQGLELGHCLSQGLVAAAAAVLLLLLAVSLLLGGSC
jgi:hypothetical protein